MTSTTFKTHDLASRLDDNYPHHNANSPSGPVGDASSASSATKAPAVMTVTALDMEAITERCMVLGRQECLDAIRRVRTNDAQWRNDLAKVARMTDIEKRRVPDHRACLARCKKCARCIHAFAWWARGGRPYRGVEGEFNLAMRKLDPAGPDAQVGGS